MTTPRIEEIEREFRNKWKDDEFYSKLYEYEDVEAICDYLRQALTEAHQAGIDEAVLDKEKDLITSALMGMLTAGFPEELANKHASLIAKSIMINPSVEREALQDNK